MSQQPPPDPYGQPQPQEPYPQQQDPYAQQQQGYSQPAGYPSGGYGYAAPPPKKPLDLAKIVFIAAWVVVGLVSLRYFYGFVQDGAPYGYEDVADRLFDGLRELAEGIFWAGLLLTASKWLERAQQD